MLQKKAAEKTQYCCVLKIRIKVGIQCDLAQESASKCSLIGSWQNDIFSGFSFRWAKIQFLDYWFSRWFKTHDEWNHREFEPTRIVSDEEKWSINFIGENETIEKKKCSRNEGTANEIIDELNLSHQVGYNPGSKNRIDEVWNCWIQGHGVLTDFPNGNDCSKRNEHGVRVLGSDDTRVGNRNADDSVNVAPSRLALNLAVLTV